MGSFDYDLAIIGAGWAGFNAAQEAKALGLRVCLIEREQIGGTCLNRGCIPTKSLIQSAKVFALTKKFQVFGLEVQDPKVNFSKVQQRKGEVIEQLRRGMQFMLKGADYFNREAQILSPEELKLADKTLTTKSLLIATGSRPIELSCFKFDTQQIISSDEILNLKEIPRSLLIIGGGVIGCEFASLFSTLGSQVTLVELMPQLLPGEDKEVAKKLDSIFKKRKILVNTNTDATNFPLKDYSLVLVCVGREPNTKGLGLEKIGLNLSKAKVIVDDYLRTNIPNIYAAGDCTGKIMLAHFAAYQGRIAAENIAHPDHPQKADNQNIPNCIFTDPEIASVGLKEKELKSQGRDIKIHRFDFLASGMARILDETEGFIKIISDQKTEEVLGASIIGPRATELIGILTLAITSRLKVWQLRNTVFAHPTISEGIAESVKTDYEF